MQTTPSRLSNPPRFPWKIFWLLLIGAVAGMGALLPLVFALYRKLIATGPLPMPLPVLIAVQLMETAILFAGLIAIGLRLSLRIGIEMPLLQRWLYGAAVPAPKNAVRTPVLAGIAVAIIALLIFYTFFLSRIPEWPVAAEAALPIWKRFLACFYGGINEEILARLFAFSFFAWLIGKITRRASLHPGPVVFWITNLIVSLLFAAAHLPAAKVIMPITPILIMALVTINGMASLVFGYLFWKRGLEAAIVAHFTADFVLHVIGPMFIRG